MFQLAQAVSEDPGRLLGLTVLEWGVMIPMLATLVVAVIKAYKGAENGKKLEAVVFAVEETGNKHPEAIRIVKRLVRDKATKLGVQVGLHEDTQRATAHFKALSEEETKDA